MNGLNPSKATSKYKIGMPFASNVVHSYSGQISSHCLQIHHAAFAHSQPLALDLWTSHRVRGPRLSIHSQEGFFKRVTTGRAGGVSGVIACSSSGFGFDQHGGFRFNERNISCSFKKQCQYNRVGFEDNVEGRQ
jgi:hypothetical protein